MNDTPMRRPLFQLSPGTRFRLTELDLTGTLLAVSDCRARVRLDQPVQEVEFTGPDGRPRSFQASRNRETSWASTVVVEALSVEPLTERDLTMAKKTTMKASAKKAPAKKADGAPKAPRTKTPKPDGKLSQLDAAIKVLTEAGEPMTTKAMIDAMAAKGYWTSPGGHDASSDALFGLNQGDREEGGRGQVREGRPGAVCVERREGAGGEAGQDGRGEEGQGGEGRG